MACTDAFATAQEFADFFCQGCDDQEELNVITSKLELAAADVHIVMAAANACDCTLSDWGERYLKKLNIIDAAVIHNCRCSGVEFTPDEGRMWLEWLDRQFELIRMQEVDVCEGATGANWPSIGWAPMSWTERNAARIIADDVRRTGVG